MRMHLSTKLADKGIVLRHYNFGNQDIICPQCSHMRKPANRRKPVLNVKIDSIGATWHCNHCSWSGGVRSDVGYDAEFDRGVPQQPDDTERRMFSARAIWSEALSINNSLAQQYLLARGITNFPQSLRFHASLRHSKSGMHYPAMVAGVQNSAGRIIAVQRTFLRGNSKAPCTPNKMTLGPLNDGAVRLASVKPVIGIAEGVETALSAMQIFGIPCWAALGKRFDAIEWPDCVQTVVAFGDNGAAGMEAVRRILNKYQGRYSKIKVIPKFPSEEFEDFNDELQATGDYGATRAN